MKELFVSSPLVVSGQRRPWFWGIVLPLDIKPTDVIPTGNEWISLPTIRASDGAIENFNVLSMNYRGLLEVSGDRGAPSVEPYYLVSGKPIALQNLSWRLIANWIPTATFQQNGLDFTLTYCAPSGSRAALLKLSVANHTAAAVPVTLRLRASWGRLSRVTYTPVELHRQRTANSVPWGETETLGAVISFIDTDTGFAWSVVYPESTGSLLAPPVVTAPMLNAAHPLTVQPNAVSKAHFILGVGVKEYSASQSAQALAETIDREGFDAVIEEAAAWCRARSRSTGLPGLDQLLNRNLLFTSLYAWGRRIDTEQLVGVTSRSPRSYVSAAYWDRDAMLWSFPGLLDVDVELAREALEYAFTIQLRNTGIHSRFIDGVAFEDGLELDEVVAPIFALSQYMDRTRDTSFLTAHRDALRLINDRILSRYDPNLGLYSTLQDAQDQYRKQAFSTYNNVLVWQVFQQLSGFYEKLDDAKAAADASQRAAKLHAAIMSQCLADAPGASGKIFVSATDGKNPTLADVPSGPLMKLPALGFVAEDDPLFVRTYQWLHSTNYAYSNFDKPYGLPGSYRVPFTTPWAVADELRLTRGREKALNVLTQTTWDGGIISEGADPTNGTPIMRAAHSVPLRVMSLTRSATSTATTASRRTKNTRFEHRRKDASA